MLQGLFLGINMVTHRHRLVQIIPMKYQHRQVDYFSQAIQDYFSQSPKTADHSRILSAKSGWLPRSPDVGSYPPADKSFLAVMTLCAQIKKPSIKPGQFTVISWRLSGCPLHGSGRAQCGARDAATSRCASHIRARTISSRVPKWGCLHWDAVLPCSDRR